MSTTATQSAQCDSCTRFLKSKAAISQQVAALTRENESLLEQVSELTRQLEEARSAVANFVPSPEEAGALVAGEGSVPAGEDFSHITPEMIAVAGASFPFDLGAGLPGPGQADSEDFAGTQLPLALEAAGFDARQAPLPTTGAGPTPCTGSGSSLVPDVFTDGEGAYPEQFTAYFRPQQLAEHKTEGGGSSSGKPLSACLVPSEACEGGVAMVVSSLDKKVSAFAAAGEGDRSTPVRLLATSMGPSPALSLTALSNGLFVSGHMDGSVGLWSLTHAPGPSLTLLGVSAGHTKFVTRLTALNGGCRGSDLMFVSASTDGTLAFWKAEARGVGGSSDGIVRLRRLQLLSFPGGAVTSLAWAGGHITPAVASLGGASDSPGVGTLVVTVASSPYFYYLTVLSERRAVLQRIPISADGLMTSLHDGVESIRGDLASVGGANSSVLGSGGIVAAPTILSFSAEPDSGQGQTTSSVVSVHSEHVASAASAAAASSSSSSAVSFGGDFGDSLHRYRNATSSVDVVPVGFFVVDMDAACFPSATRASGTAVAASSSPWLLAVATSSGLVLVYRFGTSHLVRTLAGHLKHVSPTFSGSASSLDASSLGGASSSLKVRWWCPPVTAHTTAERWAAAGDQGDGVSTAEPQCLLASTDAGDDVLALGLASCRPIRTLSAGTHAPGSTAHSRSVLRVMETCRATQHRGLLLTLDNSGNVGLRTHMLD